MDLNSGQCKCLLKFAIAIRLGPENKWYSFENHDPWRIPVALHAEDRSLEKSECLFMGKATKLMDNDSHDYRMRNDPCSVVGEPHYPNPRLHLGHHRRACAKLIFNQLYTYWCIAWRFNDLLSIDFWDRSRRMCWPRGRGIRLHCNHALPWPSENQSKTKFKYVRV